MTCATRFGLIATAALVACLALAGSAAAKGKATNTVDLARTVNLPIPDAAPPAPGSFFAVAGALSSTVEVGKQSKGRQIRDVNVTVQTQGTSGTAPTFDLVARLTAPNGATTTLFTTLFSTINPMTFSFNPSPSVGPLTLDDEAPLELASGNPNNPTELHAPFVGRAEPDGKPLGVMDGGPARGSWKLTVLDVNNTQTSNLVSWRLNVVAGKPFLTK